MQKIWFDDWVFRLETDNTLDASQCRYRERYEGTTIEGNIALIQDLAAAVTAVDTSVQTTF